MFPGFSLPCPPSCAAAAANAVSGEVTECLGLPAPASVFSQAFG